MPRALSLGNGNLLVMLDKKGLIQDFYYPYVGMEDHTTYEHYHRIGLFEENTGEFSWLTEKHWESENGYLSETLVGRTVLKSEEWEMQLEFTDFVHPIDNIFCRRITFKNLKHDNRRFRLFFNYDFHIYGVKGNDTAYYSPKGNHLVFYKFNRYFLLNGASKKGGIDQFTTGKAEYRGLEGTWRDAEDGELSAHPIEQGSVDATFAIHTEVQGNETAIIDTWICAGHDSQEVSALNKKIQVLGVDELLDYTTNYWHSWVNKQNFNFTGITPDMIDVFKQSLLIIRTQIDNRGAILAANDSDIIKFNKDTYSYMWPRDGALVAHALDNTGYNEITKRFYQFCEDVQEKEGFLMHKYNPDGSLGSSWHPWLYEGEYQVPLQEDETALPVWALWNHYQRVQDIEFMQEIFDKFVRNAAEFMCRYRDKETGLPLPSYDLWEEKKGIYTYTCSTVYAGLMAASHIANVVGHDEHARRYEKAAEEVKEAMLKYLFCPDEQCFVKKINWNKGGEIMKDYQADASVSAIFLFDVLPVDDERVVKTMKRIKEKLEVKTKVGGIARYENDRYMAVDDYPENIPGNPWIITTLWYAQWLFRLAKDFKSPEFEEGEKWLRWATKQVTPTKIFPEQINPYDGEHLSVAPLTWSHATYVDTLMLYRQRLTDFGICEECFIPTPEF